MITIQKGFLHVKIHFWKNYFGPKKSIAPKKKFGWLSAPMGASIEKIISKIHSIII